MNAKLFFLALVVVAAQAAPITTTAPAATTAAAVTHKPVTAASKTTTATTVQGALPAGATRPVAKVRAGVVSKPDPSFVSRPEPIPRGGQGVLLRNQLVGVGKTFQLGVNTVMRGMASGTPDGFMNGLQAANKQVSGDMNGVLADTQDALVALNDYVAAGGNPLDMVDLTLRA